MSRSYNPIDCWCADLNDMILQHLPVKDLLNLAEVSPSLCDFVSTNKKFLKSVKLKLDSASRSMLDQDFKVLLKTSGRNYVHLELDGNEVFSKMPLILMYHKTGFESITMRNMIFNRPTLLQEFIDGAKSSLHELVLDSVFIFNCVEKVLISLPKLKRLEMIECNDQESTVFRRVSFVISGSKNLEYLKLMYSGISEENQKSLLSQNPKIKDLTLTEVVDSIFEKVRDVGEMELEKLEIHFLKRHRYERKPNFERFLSSQSSFLKKIDLYRWISILILETIYQMPKIESLNISKARKTFLIIDCRDLENRLVPNSTLRELMLTDDLTGHQNLWHILLRNSPKLNRFQMFNSSYLA